MIRRIDQVRQNLRIQNITGSPWRFFLGVLLSVFILNLSIGDPIAWAQDAVELTPVAQIAEVASSRAVETEVPARASLVDSLNENDFLGVPFWDDDIYKMVVRFFFNLFFLSLVVGVAYTSNNEKNQRYMFNFLIMNIVVFFICFTLKKLELELGMALGLFAIFAIIRYRTAQIDVKDMTYLFVVIGLAVINSLSNKKTSYVELIFTNAAVFGACLFMERFLGPELKKVKLTRSEVVYDKLDLLRPENVEELYDDLYKRTGIRADRVEIKQIDFLNGTSLIDIRQSKERAFVHQDEVASAKVG